MPRRSASTTPGRGVDPALTEEIFRDGYTTKVARARPAHSRGLGLALVSQEVRRRRGTIAVENVDGAVFTVAPAAADPVEQRSGP